MSKNLTTVMKDIGLTLMSTLEYSYEEIKEEHSKIKETLKAIIGDITELSADELRELGFIKYKEDKELYLMPLWAFDLIPDGTELESINGNIAVKGIDEINLEEHFGVIAWGLNKSLSKLWQIRKYDQGHFWNENYQLMELIKEVELKPNTDDSAMLIDGKKYHWCAMCPADKVVCVEEISED